MMFINRLWIVTAVAAVAVRANPVPLLDAVPVVSQLKWLVQMACGDPNGAAETFSHYLDGGIGPAQARSAYHLVTGDFKKARDIQTDFLRTLEPLLDGAPVFGHLKGAIHLLVGDREHGLEAIKSATSTTGAVVGALLGGPVGAVAGHVATDVAISGVDVALRGNESEPHGMLDYAMKFGDRSPGEHFDAAASLLMDGLGGLTTATAKTSKAARTAEASSGGGGAKQNTGVTPPVESGGTPTVGGRTAMSTAELERASTRAALKTSRVGLYQFVGTVRDQLHLTMSLSPYQIYLQQSQSAFRNAQSFIRFARHVNEDHTCVFYNLFNREMANILSMKHANIESLRHSWYLEELDLNAIKNQLAYLTDAQKSMITKNEFRTIRENYQTPNDCFGCTVAGTLSVSLDLLQNRMLRLSERAYHATTGTNPALFLEECKRIGILDYQTKGPFMGVGELFEFLKTHASELNCKRMVMTELSYSEQLGHAVQLKMKTVAGVADPDVLVIDYQMPAFLEPGKPNPFRFTPFIDAINYSGFYLYILQDFVPQPR